MIGIIVAGHGNFASGITSMLELVVGKPENTRLCGPHNRREARTTLTIMARMRIKTFQSVALEDVFAVLRTFIMKNDRFTDRCSKTYRSNSGRKIS